MKEWEPPLSFSLFNQVDFTLFIAFALQRRCISWQKNHLQSCLR